MTSTVSFLEPVVSEPGTDSGTRPGAAADAAVAAILAATVHPAPARRAAWWSTPRRAPASPPWW